MKKRNFVEWAMHYRQIVILAVTCLVAFGIYSLPNMRKNEFPDFTVRQGIVVAVAPGNTSQEMAEQVAKPLEQYIFSYKEVKKEKTFSQSRDGIVYIQVQLNDEVTDKDAFWSKFKHGVSTFKAQLPKNVLAVQVMDDFGDTSALLITMESKDKTYRELDDYMDLLQDRLRQIPSVGRITVSGMQQEQISVYIDNDRLAQYGLNEQAVAMALMQKGFTTSGGRLKTDEMVTPVYVSRSFNAVYDVQQQIVYADPKGNVVRLKDIARVTREYPKPDSYITNNGKKCLLLSVEMKQGKDIVAMGREVNRVLEEFQKEVLPSEVGVFRITDQSQVVGDSVLNFLKELLIAIVAVVIVVMLLLPLRVALVAASTIPITIFISLGLLYTFDFELNTVSLAALIVTLGMIVDNSIVIIDNYLEKLGEGMSRWRASIESATHFFKSILSATLAISITFFPFLITTRAMLNDFLRTFPWTITLILGVSLMIATMLVPFMQFWFIRKPMQTDGKSFSFLDMLQKYYNRLIAFCFRWPKSTVAVGLLSIVVGILLIGTLPMQMMPNADRRQDPRVVSVASFKGCASPRFHTSYAPQLPGTNYSQFIVNTTGIDATVEVLDEYAPRLSNAYPEARVRFKQISYSEAVHPVEFRLSGECLDTLRRDADKLLTLMRGMPDLILAHTDMNEPQPATCVTLKEDEASRLGINNVVLETTLAMRYGNGLPVATIWDGDYAQDVVLKGEHADRALPDDLENELIPVMGGLAEVPLRQIAQISPVWKNGQIVRRNGVYTITVSADLQRGGNGMEQMARIQSLLPTLHLSPHTTVTPGGDVEDTNDKLPSILAGLAIAAVIILFVLIAHFKRVGQSLLIFASMSLCLFGTAAGIILQGVDFSVTCFLGIVALMGIIVRNGIIMFDYAEELRRDEHLHVREAIFLSARRRMRPIFLTSAAASMGVIPMILGGSGLWMPMGTVICYGTLITMVFLLTVLPCAYLLCFQGSTERREKAELLETK